LIETELVIPMPDAGILATVLLVVGLFLLGLEFFVPSFGMIGSLAVVSLVVSLWSAFKAWGGGQNPVMFYTYLLLLIAGIPGTLGGVIYAIQHTSLGKAIVLRPPEITTGKPLPLSPLVGKRGIAGTMLTPGGIVIVDDARYHAESQGMVIDPGSPVLVVGVTGNRITVRPLAPGERDQETSNTAVQPSVVSDVGADTELLREPTEPASRGDRLDFDIPEDYMT
jgi:membrane-bound serine protease (ClpP class)